MALTVLPRYLVGLMLPYLLVALGIFSAVLFMNEFVKVFNQAVMLGASLGWVGYSMVQLLPMVLSLSIPMAFQLALLLTLTGLSENGELLALRAAGFSVRQIVWPLGVCAVALAGLLLWVNNFVAPNGFHRFSESQQYLAESITDLRLEPKTFVNVGTWRIYAEKVGSAGRRLGGVMLFRYSQSGGDDATLRISAPSGSLKIDGGKGVELLLSDGEFQRADPQNPRKTVMAYFKKYQVFIPFGRTSSKARNISLTETTTPDILRTIRAHTLVKRRHAEYIIEVVTRFSIALSPMVFFLISCPLGMGMSKRNRGWGMILSILVLFVFYGMMAVGISMAKKFYGLAWWSPWLGIVSGLAAAGFLWRKRMD